MPPAGSVPLPALQMGPADCIYRNFVLIKKKKIQILALPGAGTGTSRLLSTGILSTTRFLWLEIKTLEFKRIKILSDALIRLSFA